MILNQEKRIINFSQHLIFIDTINTDFFKKGSIQFGSPLSGRGPKDWFFASDNLGNHTNKGKGKEK